MFGHPAAVERPYPAGSLAAEVIMLFVLALLDVIRIFTGEHVQRVDLHSLIVYVYCAMNEVYWCTAAGAKGNLTGRRLSLSLSLVFLLPVFFGYLYLTVWQTFMCK